ncbi:hypothetical protein F511_43885 [Dorcoceras hygrometricum]|uniref:Uncharacterized protein n=1 Tax=Dorcoceras hygrometricum TaxID=472368 RepID=A0A2Z7C7N3_9LAMI|nr:hypothetical protein F511_43885 [Dorcoceras hygrometricum]
MIVSRLLPMFFRCLVGGRIRIPNSGIRASDFRIWLLFVMIVSRLLPMFFRCLVGGRIRIPNSDRKRKSGSKSPGRRLARRRPPHRARYSATPSRAGRAMETLASCAGRTTRAWWPDERVHAVGRFAGRSRRESLRRWSSVTGDARRRFTKRRPTAAASLLERWPTMIAQALGIVVRYWPAVVESRCAAACVVVRTAVRPCGARNFHGGAGPPPLRRCSGESPAMS